MILGIDLGTTYSVGAYLDSEKKPQLINNSEGSTITPSVVLFEVDNQIVVGEVAKDNAVMNPENVVSVVKNYMGKKIVLKEYGEQSYTPEMISSFILRKIVQDAEKVVNEEINGVVITVPAYFTDAQRKATEDAATMAGISLFGMINEPTAAALCYADMNQIENENILIYDLGGGTFDVTILRIKEANEMEVLSTGGLSNAGGRFFDQYIVDYVINYMDEKYGIDLEEEEYMDDLQELYIKAENVKLQLSNKSTASIVLKIGKIKERIEISRELFESMIRKLYGRTESKIKECLKAAGMEKYEVDKILLVGGSSRIPYIETCLEQYMGKEISKEINPDEVVAKGAAIYGNVVSKKDSKKRFTDVCSHSIGVVVVNKSGEEENEVIISRNSSIPTESEERFRTIVDKQERISLSVTEGEYKELTDVTRIGNFDIELPRDIKANSLVIIKISLDQNQLIHIKLNLPEYGFEKEHHMKRIANMEDCKIENMTGILRDYKVG